MKKNIKKIIVGIFGFVLLFGAQNALASTWNGASNDCKGISIVNSTTNEGYAHPCWPSTSISADAGDTLNVRIYYHNTGTVTADNTKIFLNAPTGSASSNKSFSGSISSNQGSLSLGSVVANLSSSQTITFNSVKWYTNNTSETLTPLLNGQSGSEILNGGLNIGSIAPGWATQGSLVISFHVSNTTAQSSTCSINSFSANPTSIISGGSSILSWDTDDCTSVSISNLSYNFPVSGSQIVYPTNSTTYVLTALDSNGVIKTKSVYINVSSVILKCNDIYATNYLGALPCVYSQTNYKTCRITDFDADDTSIEDGDSTILRWETENCNSVNISGVANGLSKDGSYRVYPRDTKTYTLNAYGSYGSDSDTVKIYVDEDENDDDDDDDSRCSIDSFKASDTYINQGDSSVLKWKTTDCDNVSISGLGSVDDDDSETVYPYTTTIYTLRAYGDNGIKTKYVTVNVNYNYNNIVTPVVIYNSNVVTTVATNVSQTAAQLNGLITNSNNKNSNVYFEYGTSVNLGSRTAPRTLSSNTNFSEYISGLSPYTIYYFQAVSEGSNGVSRGAIEVFRTVGVATNNVTTTTRTIIQGTTVIGTESPVMLKIENRYQSIGVNDIIEYTVTYKNIGNVTLLNPIIQVVVPKGIILTNYTSGTYSEDTNTLTVPINDLDSGEEGFINLQGQVYSIPSDTAQVVTTAVFVYTNRNGAQENAIAYVLNNLKGNTNLLGASAFFSGIFPSSLIGWLFLLILILLLVLITRSIYNKKNEKASTSHQ